MIRITIDNTAIEIQAGASILEAARSAGIYIPALCSHPDFKPFHSIELSDFIYRGQTKYENDDGADIATIDECGICYVKVEGVDDPVPACETPAEDGMKITTNSDQIKKIRQKNLIRTLATHPHSCLTCSQREGCLTLTADCSNSVPIDERCCSLKGNCELENIALYVGIAPETPKYHFASLPRITDEPLINRDYNLCIACGRCVRVCRQVRGVNAMGAVISNGKLVVGTANGTALSQAECRFCTACVEVCPTGALQDKQKARLSEKADLVPCKAGCPADVNIPLYLWLVSQGDFQGAAEVNAEKLSIPSILGKVCFHPCEDNCRRNEVSEILNGEPGAVSNRQIKDFAMNNADLPPVGKLKSPATGKNIAVIGSGPAGLTASYLLSLKGHDVTVYEKEAKPGGMLMYGIPRYRLPEDVIEKDIGRIIEAGVKIRTNTKVGDDITLSDLKENYDSVFIAAGLSKSRDVPIPGSDIGCVLKGVEFLRDVAYNADMKFDGEQVAVIGGGNVAIDAARTALRLGAGKVNVICLEQRDEMPAYRQEIIEAEEEGVEIINGWGINNISESGESHCRIYLKKCTRVFDENGGFNPDYDEAITESILCDKVILCIGQEADFDFIDNGAPFDLSFNGVIEAERATMQTSVRGIYAGGDIVSGPASAVEAVASGRKAACAIDKFLGGNGDMSLDYGKKKGGGQFLGKGNGFAYESREKAVVAEKDIRINNFDLVESTYSEEQAIREASRCLKCNLRLKIGKNPLPPEEFIKFALPNFDLVPEEEGVLQLLNAGKEVYFIKGCADMRAGIKEMFDDGKSAEYFTFEPDKMFTQRESELIQQYLQKHGEMPGGGDDDLDDLF